MTYNQEKSPWIIAQSTDLLIDQEIAMESAVPKVIPLVMVSFLYDIYPPVIIKKIKPKTPFFCRANR